MADLSSFEGKAVLVTGGLGFIGSSLARSLVGLGAKVTILNTKPLHGGNYFNLADIQDKLEIIIGDIRDPKFLEEIIPSKDYLFSLAAKVGAVDSAADPFEDLDVNCRGQLAILETCRKFNRDVKIFFSSSRLVYGPTLKSSVAEDHPTDPTSFYGIHKLTAEKYYQAYYKNYGIRSVIGRLTNPYGVRQQIKHGRHSLPGWFMRLAMEGKPIQIFGKGTQLRDYIYIDDLVEAILVLMAKEDLPWNLFNIGSGVPIEFREMVQTVVDAVGTGKIEYVPWPEDYKKVETGDSIVDISRLRKATGWKPSVSLAEGVRKMTAYYKLNLDKYLD
jgi:UDP-glucose 4-epimerase